MNQVANISRLTQTVKGFHGSTVDDAIKAAEKWAIQNGMTLAGNYYLQVKLGRSESIIVDIKPNSEL